MLASSMIGYFSGRSAGFSSKTLKIYIAIGLVTGFFSAVLMGQLQNIVMSFSGLEYSPSTFRFYGVLIFLPLLFSIPVKYLAGDFDRVTDVFSAGTYALLGISKLGCAASGCCYGIACTPGVYSRFAPYSVFPVQLLEAGLSILLCIVIFCIAKNKKHRKGTVYPLSLVLYGVMRFFVEFLRYYPPEELSFFGGISFWQWMSLITVAVGGIWLIYKYHGKSRVQGKYNRLYEE